jgi:hypothetical protein
MYSPSTGTTYQRNHTFSNSSTFEDYLEQYTGVYQMMTKIFTLAYAMAALA